MYQIHGNRIACGWKNCLETFGSTLDMNAHVQLNHLSYSVQVQVSAFHRPPDVFTLPELLKPSSEDRKPHVAPRVPPNPSNPIELDEDPAVIDLDSSSVSDPSTRVRKFRCGPRIGFHSAYWTFTDSNEYKCKECSSQFVAASLAVSHYRSRHGIKKSLSRKSPAGLLETKNEETVEDAPNSSSSSSGMSSSNAIRCVRRGCRHVFSSQSDANEHFCAKHVNKRNHKKEEEIAPKEEPGGDEPTEPADQTMSTEHND
ncbi:unnamed protein product [Caenorhabditis sp. 36 PRJEB53466]|nr:unnamed protein product [Caenorhabditis sp. 36 PRJEB53466]